MKLNQLGRIIYPKRLWKMPPQSPPALYLTFDDGPIPGVTEWVLKELEKYSARATFFCIGDNIDKHPAIYKSIKEAGHTLGHHSQNHLNGWNTPKKAYLENVDTAAKKVNTRWFRPPYGRATFGQAKALHKSGFQLVMWDVLAKDYRQDLSPQHCWEIVKKHSRNGSIIVLHDSLKAEKNLRYLLPKTLEYFSQRGFEFKGLD